MTSDLLNDFKANFPRFNSQVVGTTAPAVEGSLAADALDVSVNPRYVAASERRRVESADATNFIPAIVANLQQNNSNG